MLLHVASILAILAISFAGLWAFGPPRRSLVYSRQDKEQWDKKVASRLGAWLTITNIAGTLTSFATVFVFYLGNAQVFGLWMIVTVITIWLGGFATVAITNMVVKIPRYRRMLQQPDQSGAIVASLFWYGRGQSASAGQVVKMISLANIGAVIWLEFAVLADVGGRLLGLESIVSRSLLLFGAAATVLYFVLRFGLRGFIFADVFQTPIIALGALTLVAGVFIALAANGSDVGIHGITAVKPILSPTVLFIFAAHVACLNAFLVVVTEPHWLRMWAFQGREIDLQLRSTGATAVVWLILMFAGLGTAALTGGKVGETAIVELVSRLEQLSPLFVTAFWFAGIAALFSTADAQIYSFMLVRSYDPQTGESRSRMLLAGRATVTALLCAASLTTAYYFLRTWQIPFEKLVFIIIPASLNILPGLVRAARRRFASTSLMLASLVGFGACAGLGFAQPEREFAWTLAAGLVPILVAAFAFFTGDDLPKEVTE